MRMSASHRRCRQSPLQPAESQRFPGPTFAPEVARGEPTALVVASPDESLRLLLQRELSAPRFRLYTNPDMIGVEIAAAMKNIIAIAAGVADGLGLGSNADSRAGHPRPGGNHPPGRGMRRKTRNAFRTCRAWRSGSDLLRSSEPKPPRRHRAGTGTADRRDRSRTCAWLPKASRLQSTVALARKLDVEMPIAEKMYSVLYEGLEPQDAINDLMERKLKEE